MKKVILVLISAVSMNAAAQSLDIPLVLDSTNFSNISAITLQSMKDQGLGDLVDESTTAKDYLTGKDVAFPSAALKALKDTIGQASSSAIAQCPADNDEAKNVCITKAIQEQNIAVEQLNKRYASVVDMFGNIIRSMNSAYIAQSLKDTLSAALPNGLQVMPSTVKVSNEDKVSRRITYFELRDDASGIKHMSRVKILVLGNPNLHNSTGGIALDYTAISQAINNGENISLVMDNNIVQFQFAEVNLMPNGGPFAEAGQPAPAKAVAQPVHNPFRRQ